jgi:hypothetical protein
MGSTTIEDMIGFIEIVLLGTCERGFSSDGKSKERTEKPLKDFNSQ